MPRPSSLWTPGTTRPSSIVSPHDDRPASLLAPGDELRQTPNGILTGLGTNAQLSSCASLGISDAIVKARIVFAAGYDNGEFQSLFNILNAAEVGAFPVQMNGWEWMETGGRNGKGYLKTTAINDGSHKAFVPIEVAFENLDAAGDVPYSEAEINVRLGGMHVAFNLFGQTIVDPLAVLATFATSTQIHTMVEILPDLTLRGTVAPGTILDTSGVVTVPADGWFVLEKQWCISRRGNTTSGFLLCKLFTPENLAVGGQVVLRAIGVKTQAGSAADSFKFYAFGSQCVSTRQGLEIGIDDVVLYSHDGTEKRWINDAHVGAAWPVADVEVGSKIDHAWTYIPNIADPITGVPPTDLSGASVFGLTARYLNATRLNLFDQPPTSPGFHSNVPGEWIADFHGFGAKSTFSTPDFWTEGPFPYAGDTLRRNYFGDDAADIYAIDVNDLNIVQVEGVQPFVAQGRRQVTGTLSPGDAVAALGSPHDIDTNARRANTVGRPFIRSNGAIGRGRYSYAETSGRSVQVFDADENFIFNSILWGRGGQSAYTKNPYSFIDIDPDGNVSWRVRDPLKLLNVQLGIQGDFDIIDGSNALNPGRYDRWVGFDIAQLGLEYVYHTRIFREDEHPPEPPRAGIGTGVLHNLTIRRAVVYAASIDWDGTIVSQILDWGDGSPTVDLTAGDVDMADNGESRTVEHIYTHWGDFNITLTATDSDGLVTVATLPVSLPNIPPVANFSVADGGGNAAVFTDLSTDGDGDDSIVSWAWAFGDGEVSAAQNPPSHEYAAPGTYHVTLMVTDDAGATSLAEVDVTVPLAAPADCDIFA